MDKESVNRPVTPGPGQPGPHHPDEGGQGQPPKQQPTPPTKPAPKK